LPTRVTSLSPAALGDPPATPPGAPPHLDVQLEAEAEWPEQVLAPARLDRVRQAHGLAAHLDLESHRLQHLGGCGGTSGRRQEDKP
jgi:hypothetical protein